MAETFQCTLVTPEELVLDEQVTYASIPAWDGLLGIAPHRAPLLAKLGDGPLRLDYPAGGSRYFFVGGGFAQMKDNKLTLVTEQTIPAENIVRQDAQAALAESEARTAITDQEVADKQRQLQRARTMLSLLDHQRQGA